MDMGKKQKKGLHVHRWPVFHRKHRCRAEKRPFRRQITCFPPKTSVESKKKSSRPQMTCSYFCNCQWAAQNGLTDRIRPAGRMLPTPALDVLAPLFLLRRLSLINAVARVLKLSTYGSFLSRHCKWNCHKWRILRSATLCTQKQWKQVLIQ